MGSFEASTLSKTKTAEKGESIIMTNNVKTSMRVSASVLTSGARCQGDS